MTQHIDALKQCRDALETANNGLAWYRDRCPDAVDGSDDEASTEIAEAITAADAALSAAPVAGPLKCSVCGCNDADAPCAYPGKLLPGCLRDMRSAAVVASQLS